MTAHEGSPNSGQRFFRRHTGAVVVSILTGLLLAGGAPFWFPYAVLQWHRLPFGRQILPASPALSSSEIVVPMGPAKHDELFVVDATSGRVVRQLTNSGAQTGAPTLTTDRRTVLYSDQSGNLHAIAANGRDDKIIVQPDSSCSSIRHVSISASDPLHVVVQCRQLPKNGQEDLHDVFRLIDLKGATVRTFKTTTSRIDDPALSPDGKYLAYWGSADLDSGRSGDGGSLFIISTDGSDDVQQLTRSDAGVDADPAWSPDSSTLAFRRRGGGTDSIFTLSVVGGRQTRILHGSRSYEKPSWDPTGTKIVAVVYPGPTKEYALITEDLAHGRRLKLLQPTYDSIFAPVWSAR